MKTVIYYYTGTGNSLYIAKEVSVYLGECELTPIVKVVAEDNINCEDHKIGIVFPIYYGGLPKVVLEFVNKLRVKSDSYVFAICTKGGSEGIAMNQINSALKNSNNRLSFNHSVIMPSNYIKRYSSKSDEYNKRLIKKEKLKLLNKLQLVRESNKNSVSKDLFYYIIEPIYKDFMRKVNFKDQQFLVSNDCGKCGLCQKVCAVDNIYLINGLPSWKHECQQCMACIQVCPKKAINIGNKTVKRRRYINPYIHIDELVNQKK